MDRTAIIAKLDALLLPDPGGVIAVGGTAMAFSGLRLAADIDLMVNEANWQYLHANLHWKREHIAPGQERLIDESGSFDVWQTWIDRRVDPPLIIDFATVASQCVQDTSGYLVPSLAHQIVMKQQLARAKDEADIQLIRDHLA